MQLYIIKKSHSLHMLGNLELQPTSVQKSNIKV